MSQIPLITSLPPHISRASPTGRDVGQTYRNLSIESWQRAGFKLTSVNAAIEVAHAGDAYAGLQVVEVERSAAADIGKPLVYIEDILAAALAADGPGPVVITNADILLAPKFSLLEVVRSLQPGRALIARRIDVVSCDKIEGTPYRDGFDFFAVHRDDLKTVKIPGFVFGVPWWDYMLPASLLALGVRVSLLDAPFAFHQRHSERWNPALWGRFGLLFVQEIRRNLRQTSVTQVQAQNLLASLDRACSDEHSLRVLASRLCRLLTRSQYGGEVKRMLRRAGAAVVDFFDTECTIRLPALEAELSQSRCQEREY
jgi:hypothetical protein